MAMMKCMKADLALLDERPQAKDFALERMGVLREEERLERVVCDTPMLSNIRSLQFHSGAITASWSRNESTTKLRQRQQV